MKTNVTSLEELFNLPNDVLQIWVKNSIGQPIGSGLLERAIENHPEYFPEEVEHRRKYNLIPESVHIDYFEEYFRRESEILKDQPYRVMGILYYAEHPDHYKACRDFAKMKEPELAALKEELEKKYYSPYWK